MPFCFKWLFPGTEIQATLKARQISDHLGCLYFPSLKLASYSFHNDNECHAGLYNPATSVLSCFLDITFIVFHSMSLQSRSWILFHDKCHRLKKMVQCQSCYHSSTHLLELFFSLLTFFFLGQRYHRTCFFRLRNFLFNIYVNMSVVSWLMGLCCARHCLDSFCCSMWPSCAHIHSTSPFRIRTHATEGTHHGTVTLTQQGPGDSQHKPEKRVLKEPEILINQNAQDMVCARIRPFKKHQGP